MCFNEKSGEIEWQLVIPKLGAGKVSDWEYTGVCSSPAIEGNRVYVVTNKCEVVCLDMKASKMEMTGHLWMKKIMLNPKVPRIH